MAPSSSRRSVVIGAPYRAALDEVDELNEVFSEAFTERYRRDGMAGVRVPFLNPRIWRYAIEDAADGAMLWRDDQHRIAAFNMVHRSGVEGWMGPLAVRSDVQARGRGKEMVAQGIEWLKGQGARVIGLETMPRTMDNIGFYARRGFLPGALTVTVTINASGFDDEIQAFSRVSGVARTDLLEHAAALLQGIHPGYDYTREIVLTSQLELGDTHMLFDGGRLIGFALVHTAPLVEGRVSDELRVLKLVLDDEATFPRMARALAEHARRTGLRRVAFRLQGEYGDAFRQLIALGGHVRWTDLRMALAGFQEQKPERGMVLSNWEI